MRFKSLLRVLNEAPGDNISDALPPLDNEGDDTTEDDTPSAEDALNGEVDFGDIPGMGSDGPEESKFDDKLFYKVSDHPYVQLNDHDPSSPDNPVTIVGMSKEELTSFANQQRENLAKHNIEDKSGVTGTYKDEGAARIKQLLDFIKIVAERKK